MMAGAQDPLLSVRDLKTRLDTPGGKLYPVDSVSLDIYPGEIVGLVGESGSGKSMVARSILGIVPQPGGVSGGSIIFEGHDLATCSVAHLRSVRGRRIGMVFQDATTYLNPVMPVGRQIREVLDLHVPERSSAERVHELLGLVELPDPQDAARRYPHELSGGMRQRVMIAMALACDPALIVADEPTTALDVTIQAQILELLRSLRDRLGLAVLLISHDLGVISEICERVYVMYAGRISESAPVEDFFAGPLHPYSIGLLRSAVSLDRGSDELYSIGGTVPDLANPPEGCRFHPRCERADRDRCVRAAPPLMSNGPTRRVACHYPATSEPIFPTPTQEG